MNIEKAKRILRKVQALIENMDDHGSESTLERDLLKSYLRDLYEAVSLEQEDKIAPEPATPAMETEDEEMPLHDASVHVSASKVDPELPPNDQTDAPDPAIPAAPSSESSNPPAADDPPVREENAPATVEAPAIPAAPVAEQPGEQVATMQTVATEVKTNASSTLMALFADKQGGDLADKLQATPITSIQDEMGINERILTINELFGGDPKAFQSALEALNELSDFSAAREYLLDGPASAHDWGDDERIEKAELFVQLVRRKYL